MTQGLYSHLNQTWKNRDQEKVRELMIKYRSEPSVTKLERPSRLNRARSLGYKAKKGYIIVRVKLPRGGRQRHRTNKGRRSKRHTIRKVVQMSYRWIAEQRAQKQFPNLEVLNSYNIAKDGKYYFFEVILIDPQRPEIKSDKKINWICNKNNQNRVYRGLTSAGKKSRGLTSKSPTNKARPSVRKMYVHKGHRRLVHK